VQATRQVVPDAVSMARLGSPVLASIPDASGACTGCDLKGLGSLQVIDRSIAAQTCVAGFEVQVTWSLTGAGDRNLRDRQWFRLPGR